MSGIVIEKVRKSFDTKDGVVEALKDVNLNIDSGDIYGIIGMSGAGKSTLVRCMNFLEVPTEGQVLIDGKALGDLTEKELRKQREEIGMIFQHFGHTEQFKIYEVAENAVVRAEVVNTNGSGHGALAGFLVANHADVVICGGIGGGAQSALTEAGIRFYGGVSGSADAAVQALLDGSLGYDPEARCDHHDHAHGAGHTCGEHGCGEHSCHS